MVNYKKLITLFVVGLVIWFIPHSDALSKEAWQLFAIVVATILGLILQPLPIGAVAFIGVAAAMLTNTLCKRSTDWLWKWNYLVDSECLYDCKGFHKNRTW